MKRLLTVSLFLLCLGVIVAISLGDFQTAIAKEGESSNAQDVKGADVFLTPRLPIETTGGPDYFGYTFKDNDEADGPGWVWYDISDTGDTVIWPGDADDDITAPIAIGFTFNFYGTNYDSVMVDANGYLTFTGTGASDFSNDCLSSDPSWTTDPDYIAMLWDDLDMSADSSYVYYDNVNDSTFVVQFYNARHYNGTDTFEFEAVLHSDGDVIISILDAGPEEGSSSTTSIVQDVPDLGLEYACNTASSIWDTLTVQFYYPGLPVIVMDISDMDFGEVEQDEMTSESRMIYNVGEGVLNFDVEIDQPAGTAKWNNPDWIKFETRRKESVNRTLALQVDRSQFRIETPQANFDYAAFGDVSRTKPRMPAIENLGDIITSFPAPTIGGTSGMGPSGITFDSDSGVVWTNNQSVPMGMLYTLDPTTYATIDSMSLSGVASQGVNGMVRYGDDIYYTDYNGDLAAYDDNIVRINRDDPTDWDVWCVDNTNMAGCNPNPDDDIDQILGIATIDGSSFFVTSFGEAIIREIVLLPGGDWQTINTWPTPGGGGLGDLDFDPSTVSFWIDDPGAGLTYQCDLDFNIIASYASPGPFTVGATSAMDGTNWHVDLSDDYIYVVEGLVGGALIADPGSGAVSDSLELNIIVNGFGLALGSYTGTVNVAHNDPTQDTLSFDVLFTVIAQVWPEIAVNPVALDFGEIVLGDADMATLTITNSGDDVLNVSLDFDQPVSALAKNGRGAGGESKTGGKVVSDEKKVVVDSDTEMMVHPRGADDQRILVKRVEKADKRAGMDKGVEVEETNKAPATPGGAIPVEGTLKYEDFDGPEWDGIDQNTAALPNGWYRNPPVPDVSGWLVDDNANGNGNWPDVPVAVDDPAFGRVFYLDSDGYGSGDAQDDTLMTPDDLDLTSVGQVALLFDDYFDTYSGSDTAEVLASTDGGATWDWLADMPEEVFWDTEMIDISDYAGESSVMFAFRYAGSWEWFWLVDNIRVLTPIMTIDKTSSVIDTTETDSFEVSIDGDGLTYGLWEGGININHDAPNEPSPLFVPVSFEIVPDAEDIGVVRADADADGIPDSLDTWQTVVGVVNTPDFHGWRSDRIGHSLQDATGGILLFKYSGWTGIELYMGDKIIVSGEIDQYNGTAEVVPDVDEDVFLLSVGNDDPAPVTATIATDPFWGEQYESITMWLGDVEILPTASWPAPGSSKNMTISDGTNDMTMRIDSDFWIIGRQPPGQLNITGVGGQYDSGTPPDGGYQVFPRTYWDFEMVDSTLFIKGDVNGDGVVNVVDVIIAIDLALDLATGTVEELWAADYNDTYWINVIDVVNIILDILNGQLAKIVESGEVVYDDYASIEIADIQAVASGNVPVNVTNKGDIAALQMTVKYDVDAVTFGDPVAIDRAAGMIVEKKISDGEMKIIVMSLNGKTIKPGDGTVLHLPFTVAEGYDGTFDVSIDDAIAVDAMGFEIDTDRSAGQVELVAAPKEFALSQNFPNPFNPTTNINYALPKAADVQFVIYNMLGQEVARLVNTFQAEGYYTVTWNGANKAGEAVASGVYIYRLSAGDFTSIKKMVMMK